MSGYPYNCPFRESVGTYEQAKQFVGHGGSPCFDAQHTTILSWSWDEEVVRQRVGETDPFRWFDRVLELERRNYAHICSYAGVSYEESAECPLEESGEVSITATGVLVLAGWYGSADAVSQKECP